MKKTWYGVGLHFECQKCGRCCSGPQPGYIWVRKEEINLIADYLDIPVDELRKNYLKRVGFKTSIIEEPSNKNCIFLEEKAGGKRCSIYPVRPHQCRSWPFWPSNLKSADSWNRAAQKCPGINKGPLYSPEKIRKIIKTKKWWLKE